MDSILNQLVGNGNKFGLDRLMLFVGFRKDQYVVQITQTLFECKSAYTLSMRSWKEFGDLCIPIGTHMSMDDMKFGTRFVCIPIGTHMSVDDMKFGTRFVCIPIGTHLSVDDMKFGTRFVNDSVSSNIFGMLYLKIPDWLFKNL